MIVRGFFEAVLERIGSPEARERLAAALESRIGWMQDRAAHTLTAWR